MSNLIPPLLSSSPPPIIGPLDEEDDDEFGDFRVATEADDCDDFSLPPSPQKSPEKTMQDDVCISNLDVNSNDSQKDTTEITTELAGDVVCEYVDKDFQDRRKNQKFDDLKSCKGEVNFSNSRPDTIVFDTEIMDFSPYSKNEVIRNVTSGNGIADARVSSDGIIDDYDCITEQNVSTSQSISLTSKTHSDGIGSCSNVHNQVIPKVKSLKHSNSDNEENLHKGSSDAADLKMNSYDLPGLNETNIEINSEDDCSDEINVYIQPSNFLRDIYSENVGEAASEVGRKQIMLHDDFANFADHFSNEEEGKLVDRATVLQLQHALEENETDDDFGDFESSDLNKTEFGDFGNISTPPGSEFVSPMDINEKNAAVKSEIILKEIFPFLDKQNKDFEYIDGSKGNLVFDLLKDVTDTYALMYQWSKSNSQKKFLDSLNVDMRNILHGPMWNNSMPRFAANLGSILLEPVRTEILTPTPVQNVQNPSVSSQKNTDEVPVAQFDWKGSGLINPFDSTSGGGQASTPEDCSQTHITTELFSTPSEKLDSGPALFVTLANMSTLEIISCNKPTKTSKGQLDDFTFNESSKFIPLRETHISAEVNDMINKPDWFQPTILTPDLQRKETVIDADDDDEFDDFQMVLPEDSNESTQKLNILSNANESGNIYNDSSQKQEHISRTFHTGGTSVTVLSHGDQKDSTQEHFHSSVQETDVLQPLQPVRLEPLVPIKHSAALKSQINWPDPGVTDEDVKNIELIYSRKVELIAEKFEPKTTKDKDEQWSDFISVKSNRTATLDLPLSVLNLNHVQTHKQPIPVITPSGLVQTKLSSNLSHLIQTVTQPNNIVKPVSSQLQPSIISNQFAAGVLQTTSRDPSKEDDEDWGDFVSSQSQNGYHQKVKSQQWASATTNIIMNPRHFESLQGYSPQRLKRNSAVPTKSAIPSISALPDLEFSAPNNRTSRK